MQSDDKSTVVDASNASIPRASVGLPVYNGDATIRKALDTLLAQTFADFELIISDNASTDATAQICRQYADRDARIRYVRQPQNMGAARNFEFVLGQARAEYFMWAAHDDYWHPDFIRKCLAAHEQNPGIAVAFTKYWVLCRRYAPLKMRHFPDMPFLTSEDPFTRVSSFLLMSEFTHKANMIYGLWRRPVVQEMMDKFKDVENRLAYLGLDTAQLAYVLARSKACQVPEVLFFKTYDRLPPGYITQIARTVKQRLKKPRRWKERYEANVRDHLSLVRTSLERAGATEERYKQLLELLHRQFMERYWRPRCMLRELYRAWRSGLV